MTFTHLYNLAYFSYGRTEHGNPSLHNLSFLLVLLTACFTFFCATRFDLDGRLENTATHSLTHINSHHNESHHVPFMETNESHYDVFRSVARLVVARAFFATLGGTPGVGVDLLLSPIANR